MREYIPSPETEAPDPNSLDPRPKDENTYSLLLSLREVQVCLPLGNALPSSTALEQIGLLICADADRQLTSGH